MAITTSYHEISKKRNVRMWPDPDKYVEFYLQYLSEKSEDTNYYTDKDGVEHKISPINHFPELKEYEVWMTGYAATGESAGAHLVGKAKARNFAQACHIVMCEDLLKDVRKENSPDYDKYCAPGRWDYDPSRLSYWGCELFWSEELARKSFG